MSTRIAYLDCVGGVAGDMLLAALLDAGADEGLLRSLPARLGFDDVKVTWEERRSHGFAARHVTVRFDEAAHPHHRHLGDVRAIIEGAQLEPAVASRALAVFTRLAQAEATVHGSTVDHVHFHEVGAVDAIVDIVGVCELVASLGIERLVCSALPMGRGSIDSAHGRMPLPAPAVLAMLDGVPVHDAGIEGETVTPTGLALVRELCAEGGFGPLPTMTITTSGLGCGSKERPGIPNVVRVVLGQAAQQAALPGAAGGETLVQLECHVDDLDARVLPDVLDKLLAAGALDTFVVPVLMKKGRPGLLVTVLTRTGQRAVLEELLLRQTTTLGVRGFEVTRRVLGRRQETVETPWGPVEVKVALDDEGGALRCTPEYETCRQLSERAGVSILAVLTAAQAAWKSHL